MNEQSLKISLFKDAASVMCGIVIGVGAIWTIVNPSHATELSAAQSFIEQGELFATARPLDVALSGEGFFRVKLGDRVAYTRVGSLFVNQFNELAVGAQSGVLLSPEVSLPANATGINVSSNGEISFLRPGTTDKCVAGQIELVRFANPKQLKSLGGAFFAETAASGTPTSFKPGENGAANTIAGFIEEWDTPRAKQAFARHPALATVN